MSRFVLTLCTATLAGLALAAPPCPKSALASAEKCGASSALRSQTGRAAASLALAVPAPISLGGCDCHDTGDCGCDPASCGCCKEGVPDYAAQYAESLKSGKVLVGFMGCKGACLDGALCGQSASDHPRILVGYPKGDTVFVSAELPADASTDAIKAAVKIAQGRMAAPVVQQAGRYEYVQTCSNGVCTLQRVWVPNP